MHSTLQSHGLFALAKRLYGSVAVISAPAADVTGLGRTANPNTIL